MTALKCMCVPRRLYIGVNGKIRMTYNSPLLNNAKETIAVTEKKITLITINRAGRNFVIVSIKLIFQLKDSLVYILFTLY